MPSEDASYALAQAVRAVQLSDDALSAAGIFYGMAPRADDLPFVINDLKPRGTVNRKFGGGKTYLFWFETKVVSKDGGGKEATANASPLLQANVALFQDDGTDTAQSALNETLHGMGWHADRPLDLGPLQKYPDRIGDVERWHHPHRFEIRLQVWT